MSSALPPPPPPPPPQPAPAPAARRFAPGIWIGSGIAIFGILASLVYFALQLPGTIDDIDALNRATEQEPLDFAIDEATTWQIFLEPSSESLAGTRVAVVDVATDESIALGRSSTFSYAWGSRSGRSVGSVTLEPGDYRLEVQGDARFAIGPNPGPRFVRSVIWAFAIGLPLLIGGAAFAVVSAVRDTRRRTREAEPPPPSPWSAGEWPAEPNG